MAKASNTDLDAVFGGGSSAAPAGPALPDADAGLDDYSPEEGQEDQDAPPPEFSTHALEAFPELDDAQLQALYRAIQACH